MKSAEEKNPVTSVEEYIAQEAPDIQPRLLEMRQLILRLVPPETTEKISWSMPTYQLYGDLVHFAAQKNHMGFYPGSTGVAHVEEKIKGEYKYSKGGIQLPYQKALPVALIEELVAFRVAENTRWQQEKVRKKQEAKKTGKKVSAEEQEREP